VIRAARADDMSILAEEAQLTVTLRCFFTHQSPVIKLGTPAVSVVTIKPVIP